MIVALADQFTNANSPFKGGANTFGHASQTRP